MAFFWQNPIASLRRPRRGTYCITTAYEARGGRAVPTAAERVDGWICGDWGMRKEAYFWEYTHLPTGVKISTYPVIEKIGPAKTRLMELCEQGLIGFRRDLLDEWEPLSRELC